MRGLAEAFGARRLSGLRWPGPAELALVTIALACVLLPQLWAVRRNSEQRREELRIALSTTAETTARAVDDWIRRRAVDGRRIARSPSVRELTRRMLDEAPGSVDSAGLLAALRAEEANFGDGGRIATFALLDDLGRTVAAGRAADLRAHWEPSRLAAGESAGLIDWPSAGGHPPLFAFAAPLAERRDDAPAVPYLAIGFNPGGELEDLLRGRALGRSGRTRLFSWRPEEPGGVWLADSEAESSGQCGVAPLVMLASAAESAGSAQPPASQNLEGFADCNGERVVGAWVPVAGIEGGVLALISFDEAYRSLSASRLNLLLLALSLGALLMVLVLLQTSNGPEAAAREPAPRRNLAAWAILAVSLIATAVGWLSARARVEEYRRENFAEAAQIARGRIEERLGRYRRLVEFAHAVHASFARNDPEEWGAFVDSLDREADHPALICLGLGRLSGKRFEPVAGFGCGESVDGTGDCRLCAPPPLEELRSLAGTAGVTTVLWGGETKGGAPALALVQPSGAPGEFVAAQVDFRRLAHDAGRFAEIELASSIGWRGADGEFVAAYSSETASPAGAAEARTLEFEFGGRRWSATFRPLPSPPSAIGQDYPSQLLLAGLAISVLLFDIALVLSSTRARALGIADLMTRRYRESESRTRAVIDGASDAILTFTGRGVIDTFNSAAGKLFGYSRDELAEVRIEDLLPVCTPGAVARLAAAEAGARGAECEGRRRDGTVFPAELAISRMEAGERVAHVAIVRDVSARRQAEERLRESEERYALAARGANDGLWDWDLRSNRVYYSERWKGMLGCAKDEIGESPEEWLGRVHSEDALALRSRLADHLEGRSAHFECEYRIRHSEAGYRWVLSRGIAVRDAGGRATRVAGSQSDITERKRVERQLLYDALHDSLTGLPNRAYFMSRIEQAREEAERGSRQMFGVLFLDIDRFKVVNDSLGHFVGDQLLVAAAERLKGTLRPGDTICRLGGDEFAVLVENLGGVADATAIAERIQRELETPIAAGAHEVFTAVSIGIALSSTGRETAEELLRDADIAMYRAKARGKARYEVFTRRMHSRAVEVLQVETDLRRAIERGELTLFYQPIVDLADNRVRGCEALLRWRHPKRGLVPPAEFIGIAEETGTILRLTGWLLEEACAQNRRWREAGLPPIYTSVNISPKQLQQDDLTTLVSAALTNAGLAPEALQLECTESALIDSADEAVAPLRVLHAQGVRIALDDFGTGYSSLIYLKRFPLHTIKIDKSFVQRLPSDSGNSAIASGLIAMAHSLGLHVVAEGVETAEQLRFLRDKSCDSIQGFLVSRPVPAGEFEALLAAGESVLEPDPAESGSAAPSTAR